MHARRRVSPHRFHDRERLVVKISEPPPDLDEWTCDGQADLLDELAAGNHPYGVAETS
jgi:hypothetical protein